MTTLQCTCGFPYVSSEVKGKILTDLTKNSQHLRIETKCPRCGIRNTTYFLREDLK
jgi:phage FluMu protein Com